MLQVRITAVLNLTKYKWHRPETTPIQAPSEATKIEAAQKITESSVYAHFGDLASNATYLY